MYFNYQMKKAFLKRITYIKLFKIDWKLFIKKNKIWQINREDRIKFVFLTFE
jgi:hypothetical protein